jgi:hypothetical protein
MGSPLPSGCFSFLAAWGMEPPLKACGANEELAREILEQLKEDFGEYKHSAI